MEKKLKSTVMIVITVCILCFCSCHLQSENVMVYYNQSTVIQPTDCLENNTNEKVSGANVKSQNTIDKSEQDYISDNSVDINRTTSVGRFCYSQMTKEQKLCYEKLRKAIEQHRTVLYWNNECCSPSTLNNLLMCITYDYPEYFWYSDEYCYAVASEKNGEVAEKIILKYEYTKEEVYEITEEIYPVVRNYLESVSNLQSDYEKALAGYEYIIKNTRYDNVKANTGYGSFEEMDKDTISCWNISGVFLNHNAICRGYVQAYQYLMNLQGIKCGYVYGDNHCWNVIRLDGDWYYTDITWGDPILKITHNDTGMIEYIEKGIDYSYFCMTTEQLLQIHTPDFLMNLELPECTATKDNYFTKNPDTTEINYFS